MKRVIISCICLLTFGCSNHDEKTLTLKGKWFTTAPTVSYLSLDFSDSTVVFDTRADTILRFNYFINQSKRQLWLTDVLGKRLSADITKLDDDSLVFNKLWALDTSQHFYKQEAKPD